MKRKICFATGNLWRWNKDRNKLLSHVQKLDVDGVELTLGIKEDVYNFKLSRTDADFIKNLDYISIHSPFRLLTRADDDKEIIKQLDSLQKIYNLVNSENLVIHPNQLPDKSVLKDYDMAISIENLPKKRNIAIPQLKRLANSHNSRICLDVSHAYLWSKEETGKIVKAFGDDIAQIHFSGTYKKKDHQSLRVVTNDFLESIEPIKKLNCPIIIEEDIKTKSIKYVKDEIDFIRTIF